jgi:hypothetical protein
MDVDDSKYTTIVNLLRDVIQDHEALEKRVEALEHSLVDTSRREKSLIMAIENSGYPAHTVLKDAENIYANMA